MSWQGGRGGGGAEWVDLVVELTRLSALQTQLFAALDDEEALDDFLNC